MKFNDEELMVMFRTGMKEAFDMLYERYSQRIFRFALSCLHNSMDAEDVVQEVFVRVARSASMYEPRGRFRAWIFQIAMNRIRSMVSVKSRATIEDHDFSVNDYDNLSGSEDRTELQVISRDILEKSLASLPEMQRLAIVLREVEGMHSRDIADTLGTSHENVRVLIHRARRNMLSFLERNSEVRT